MKRIFLLSFAIASSTAFAQAQKNRVLPTDYNVAVNAIKKSNDVTNPSVVRTDNTTKLSTTSLGKGATYSKATKIGETMNNQQTNGSIYTRVYAHAGGKISATWTSAQEGIPAGSSSRGSGYNHFNGTSWGNPAQSSLRVDPERTGFPNYAFSASTNEEMILSHIVKASGTANAGAATGIMLNRKTGLGAGTWTGTAVLDSTNILIPGILWNRSVVSGNYLHVYASFTDSGSAQPNGVTINGIKSPQVYSRLNLTTNAWEVKKMILPGYTSDRIFSGGSDNYAMDAKGSNVAILIGGLTDDIMLFKSSDNGSNWTRTIIDSFPDPAFNRIRLIDTTYSNDGSLSVTLDKNGNAHCFWALARMISTTSGAINYYPGQNEILYWKEGTSLDSIIVVGQSPDADNNGTLDIGTNWNAAGTRYFSNSIATMPHAMSVDNYIYMIFSGMTEGDADANGKIYRDVFLRYSTDLGATWNNKMLNLTEFLGFNQEQVYASISPTSDENIHVTFSQSTLIGSYDDPDNTDAGNATYSIMHLSVPIVNILSGNVGVINTKNELFNVVSNYPNPFKGTTNIEVNFTQSTNATVKVVNVMGQEVYSQNFNKIAAGLSNLEINLGNVAAGVYFYSVEANGFKTTGKMIAE
ncbi:MAG: T9SS type A sorting domain-containing protein [Bacteroidia bacterium]